MMCEGERLLFQCDVFFGMLLSRKAHRFHLPWGRRVLVIDLVPELVPKVVLGLVS